MADLTRPDLRREPQMLRYWTAVSWELTNRKEFLGQMVQGHDERAFDVYLYLLKEYDGNPESKVTLGHGKLAKALGIGGKTREAYRRQIIKVLEKLQDEYKLITVSTKYGEDSEVTLKDLTDPAKLYTEPQEKYFAIPQDYWNYGWDKILSFSGKVMYCLNLAYSAVSPESPRWYSTVETLSKRHFVSPGFISEGTMTLRKMDLVEVEYDAIGKDGNPARYANIYTPNDLYDPKEREAKFEELGKIYGKEKLEKALEYARLVYEDNNDTDVQTLLELEKEYGIERIEKAAGVISQKSPDNPKRSMGYLIGTIKGMG